MEGGGHEALGSLRPQAPARRVGALHRHQVEPRRHDRDGTQSLFPGRQHGARPRAHDLLRRQQASGHGPRPEPARRDAERHARRIRRQATRAHERRARLPLARDRPRVLGLRSRAARDPRVHKSVVQSQAIRTALAWAIDRPKLVQASLLGYGAPGNTQLSRNYGRFWVDLSKDPLLGYHYDPPHARQILDAAGWKVGPGGIRRKNGVRASFELAYGGAPSEKRAVTLIRAWRATSASRSTSTCTPTTSWSTSSSAPRTTGSSPTSTARSGRSAEIRARVPALAVHEGPARRLERLGLGGRARTAPVPAGDARLGHRRARQ